MRIIHLCSSGRVGGVETSVIAMIESFRAVEPAWDVAAIAPEQAAFLDRARRLGCQTTALPFPRALARFGEAAAQKGMVGRGSAGLAALAYVMRLRRTLRRLAPDVVHAHGIKMLVLSGWAAPARARLVWHVHDYVAGRDASARALRAASGRCRAVIANSRSVADDFRARVPGRAPVTVVYNAVNVDRFAPDGPRIDLDRLAGTGSSEPHPVRIGLAATLGRWKGHEVFLRALSRLPPDRRWRAYVIGDAVYQTHGSQWSMAELKALARELGLEGRVAFTGLIEDMPAALRSLDIVVHASTQPEPFGMSIAEAMACGRPIVVAMAGGAAELVRHGVDAIEYPPGDDAALARAIAALVEDAECRNRLGEEARRTATRAFDARRLGPELRRVYETASN
ncbi:MAG: glycosyltransferase family 4 protein [Acidobacteriota bacterium]